MYNDPSLQLPSATQPDYAVCFLWGQNGFTEVEGTMRRDDREHRVDLGCVCMYACMSTVRAYVCMCVCVQVMCMHRCVHVCVCRYVRGK